MLLTLWIAWFYKWLSVWVLKSHLKGEFGVEKNTKLEIEKLCSEKDLNTVTGKEPEIWNFNSRNCIVASSVVPKAPKLCNEKCTEQCKSRWESEVNGSAKTFENFSTTLKGKRNLSSLLKVVCLGSFGLLQQKRNIFSTPHSSGVHFWFRIVYFSPFDPNHQRRVSSTRVVEKISGNFRPCVVDKKCSEILFMFLPARSSRVCLLLSWWMKKKYEEPVFVSKKRLN